MSDTVHVKGLSDLQRFLDQLPAKIEKNIMRSALRAGAKVILEEARARVPVSTPNAKNQSLYGAYSGALRDSLRVTTRYSRGKISASVKAGGGTKRGADVFYAQWVEYGTRPHVITARNRAYLSFAGGAYKSVNHPGAQPRPFMRPAMDTRSEDAVIAVGRQIKARLTKAGIDTEEVTIGADDL